MKIFPRLSARAGLACRAAAMLLAAGLLLAAAYPALAQKPPNVAGIWKLQGDPDQRKLTVKQDGLNLSGKAIRPDDSLSFEFAGTIDAAGAIKFTAFFDRSDAPKTSDTVFAEATQSRADAAHPNLLPATTPFTFTYDPHQEQLVGQRVQVKIDEKKDPGNPDKLIVDKITESQVSATLVRDYAGQCAAEMGNIPHFNCLDSKSEELLITVDGTPTATTVDNCDKPIQLPLDNSPRKQCVPGARLLKLKTDKGSDDVLTIAICRKYRDTDAGKFHDIAMVSHNAATGHTCYFQNDVPNEVDGTNVPSPTNDPAGFWQPRKIIGDSTGPAGVQCNACHSAGPFIWSPYVGQASVKTVDTDDWDAQGAWDSNYQNMFGGPAQTFEPVYPDNRKKNDCLGCHRFGNGANCSTFVPDYTTNPKAFATARTKDQFWMPFPYPYKGTAAAWHTKYDKAMAQIAKCCTTPGLAECKAKPADGTP